MDEMSRKDSMPKGISPYTRLRDEKEVVENKNKELEERLNKLEALLTGVGSKTEAVIAQNVAPEEDDRNELVEACYGKGSVSPENTNFVYKRQLPKREALAAIVAHYKSRKRDERMIPKEDFMAKKVNTAACYIRFTKEDITGEELSSYKDVPLWLAAERIVNHANTRVTLITKKEFDAWDMARMGKEKEWQKSMTAAELQKAIGVIARQADLLTGIQQQ